jgi:hypothetical protein
VAKEKAIAAARDAEAALVAAKQAAEVAEAAAREVEGGSRSPVAAVHEPTTSPGPTTRRYGSHFAQYFASFPMSL